MSQTKHTQGPWRVVEHNGRITEEIAEGRLRIVSDARNHEIQEDLFGGFGAGLSYCDTIAALPVYSDANARLIAAAPDMLADIKTLLEAVGEVRMVSSYPSIETDSGYVDECNGCGTILSSDDRLVCPDDCPSTTITAMKQKYGGEK